MQLTPDDPKLTAYALGELDARERAAVEAALARSPECRRAVDEIRALGTELTTALAADTATALDALPSLAPTGGEGEERGGRAGRGQGHLPTVAAVADGGLGCCGGGRGGVLRDEGLAAGADSSQQLHARTHEQATAEADRARNYARPVFHGCWREHAEQQRHAILTRRAHAEIDCARPDQ